MKRWISTLFPAMVVFIPATLAWAAPGWSVVKHGSAKGQFAVTSIDATVNHPAAIAVRLLGNVNSGEGIVSCSKGFSISSNSKSFNHAGFYILPIMRGADSCDVIASVGGSGTVTVQILRR